MAAVAPRPATLLPHLEQRQQPTRPQALRRSLLQIPAILAPRDAQQQQQQPPPPQPGAARCLPPPALPAGSAAAGTAVAFVRQRRRHRLVRAGATARARSVGHAGEESPRSGGKRTLSVLEQQELALAAGQGDQHAAAVLVDANRRLVQFFANRFVGRGLDREDLVAEGMLALERAAARYERLPGAPARFGTFAAKAVYNGMLRAVHTQSRNIRLPVHHYTDMSRVRFATLELTTAAARQPRCEEVAAACGFTVSYTAHLLRAMASGPRARQLAAAADGWQEAADDALALQGGSNLEEEQREAEEGPTDALAAEEAGWMLREELRRGLAALPPQQAAVVVMRYGLDGEGGMRPFQEIGDALGYSGSWAGNQFRLAERKLQAFIGGGGTCAAAQVEAPLADPGVGAGGAAALQEALAGLKLEEQLVVALRYGWVDGTPASFAAAGERMNRAGGSARRLFQRADSVLRAWLQAAGYPSLEPLRFRFSGRQQRAWQAHLAQLHSQPRPTRGGYRGPRAGHERPVRRAKHSTKRSGDPPLQPASNPAPRRSFNAARRAQVHGPGAAGSSADGGADGGDSTASVANAAVAAAWPQFGRAAQRQRRLASR